MHRRNLALDLRIMDLTDGSYRWTSPLDLLSLSTIRRNPIARPSSTHTADFRFLAFSFFYFPRPKSRSSYKRRFGPERFIKREITFDTGPRRHLYFYSFSTGVFLSYSISYPRHPIVATLCASIVAKFSQNS